jgi:DNA-binding transcriptional LysR family regulator
MCIAAKQRKPNSCSFALQNCRMEPMYDWGDLKVFLAVARAGSTLAAARALAVNQTTVARRIAALETALGARLFDRHQDGYRLSECGRQILCQAERVEVEAETLVRLIAQRTRDLSGVVRVTTPEVFANFWLTPWLPAFMDRYPDIKIEVVATDQRLDLARGEADVAVRAGSMPSDPGLVVRRLVDYQWTMCCSRLYAGKYGVPLNGEELNGHFVVGSDGPLAKLAPHVWLAENAPRAKRRSSCSSVANMIAAVKAGHGVGFLPNTVLMVEPDLVECFPLPNCRFSFYLTLPEALKDQPRVRAVCDFLVAQAHAARRQLEPKT